MKAKFAALFAVLILVLSMRVYAPSHPEYASECSVSDSEKATLLDALLSYNASWESFSDKQLTNIYCYYAPLYPEPYPVKPAVRPVSSDIAYPPTTEPSSPSPAPETEGTVKYISGTLELRNENSVKYVAVYFSATADESGAIKIQSVYEQENYDFESFFNKEENEKLDYWLKKLIIDLHLGDIQDKSIWVSFNQIFHYDGPQPLLRESAMPIWYDPRPVNCTEQKQAFDGFVAKINPEDKFFFDQEYSCTALFKVKISSVRNLVQQLPENYTLAYFGDTLRFSYSGEAKTAVDFAAILAKLKEEGCLVVSNNNYPEEKTESKCYAYYNDRTFSFYFSRQYGVSAFGDSVYASANLWGPVGGKGMLYASLSGNKADAYLPFAEQEIEQALKEAGIDVDVKLQKQEEMYYDKPCIMIYPPPPGCEQVVAEESAGGGSGGSGGVAIDASGVAVARAGVSMPSPTIVVSEYVSYTFSQEVAIPTAAPNWQSEDVGYAVYYRNGNAGVSISKASLSISKQDGNNYWYASFSEDSASTSIVLDVFDMEKAKQALSDSVAGYASVPADAWKVDYYPIGDGPVIYYARGGVAAAEKGIAAAAGVAAPVASVQERASLQASQAGDFQEWVAAEAEEEESRKFNVQRFFRGIFDWVLGALGIG